MAAGTGAITSEILDIVGGAEALQATIDKVASHAEANLAARNHVQAMGERSVDGWLTRLAAAELGAEQDGLLDERRRALVAHGHATVLTRKEFEVMRYLAARQGEAVARIELLNDVWGLKYDLGGNVVDAVIATLRKKLGDQASVIETIHGHGYLYRNPVLDSGSAVKAPAPRPLERKAMPEYLFSR